MFIKNKTLKFRPQRGRMVLVMFLRQAEAARLKQRWAVGCAAVQLF
jgi:hypothetical protein